MTSTKKIEAILFDLDGTIIDTNELIFQTFEKVLKDQSERPFQREHLIVHMGKPLREQLQILSGRTQVDDLTKAYRQFNAELHDALVKEFPHVREVISELYRHGVKLGIVTTKIRRTTQMGLKICGLENYFQSIVTIEDVTHPKPHPEPVLKALRELDADPGTTMMVGDSQGDIEAGNRAGVISVGVAWSLKGEDVLRTYGPQHIIHDMRDLLQMVGIRKDAGIGLKRDDH